MLNSILRSQLLYVAKIDLAGKYTYVNDHFREQLGLENRDVIDNQFVDYILAEDHSRCREAIEACKAGSGANSKSALRIPRGRFEVVTSEWEFQLIKNGELTEILCLGYDTTEKERIGRNLLSANQRLATYINNSPLGIVEYDKSLNIIQWSKRSEAIFGWTENEILSRNLAAFDLVHKEDMDATARIGEELLSGAVDGNVSFNRNYKKSGETVHCIWYNSVIKDQAGNVQSILSLVQDITERNLASQQIAASESRFRALIENGNDAVAIISMDGQPIYISSSIKRVLGYEEAEALTLDVFGLLHPEDAAGVADALKSAVENPGVPVAGHTSRMRHKDGSWRWIEATITNLIHDPHIGGIVDNFRDVTDRVETEQAIQKANRHLEQAQKIARLGYWELSLNGGENYWSDQMYTICGLARGSQKISFEEFISLVVSEERDIVSASYQSARDTDRPVAIEFRIKKADSSVVHVQAIVNRVLDNAGRAISLEGTLQDITERKYEEEAMRKLLHTTSDQNKRLKDFSFMTSHNIRSSVANLLGLTSLLEDDPGNEVVVGMIASTTLQLDATLKNISELLNFENEFNVSQKVNCNLLEVVTRIVELNNSTIVRNGINIDVQIDSSLSVKAIPAYLDSIFHNLISNAIKYGTTDVAKLIEVRAHKENGTTTVSIKDYGLGINLQENSDKLFKLGSRLHTSSDGQGLGLFMTKHQIETMGGKIELQSEVSEGSTFVVTLND